MALHVRERRALEITGRDQEATAENKGGFRNDSGLRVKLLGLCSLRIVIHSQLNQRAKEIKISAVDCYLIEHQQGRGKDALRTNGKQNGISHHQKNIVAKLSNTTTH